MSTGQDWWHVWDQILFFNKASLLRPLDLMWEPLPGPRGEGLALCLLPQQCPCPGWACPLKVWRLSWCVRGLCRMWPHNPLAVALLPVWRWDPEAGVGRGQSCFSHWSRPFGFPSFLIGAEGYTGSLWSRWPGCRTQTPQKSCAGVQYLERQCLAFSSQWTSTCPCSWDSSSSLPHPQPCPLAPARSAQQVSHCRGWVSNGRWI